LCFMMVLEVSKRSLCFTLSSSIQNIEKIYFDKII
jgi:hypothetical protein